MLPSSINQLPSPKLLSLSKYQHHIHYFHSGVRERRKKFVTQLTVNMLAVFIVWKEEIFMNNWFINSCDIKQWIFFKKNWDNEKEEGSFLKIEWKKRGVCRESSLFIYWMLIFTFNPLEVALVVKFCHFLYLNCYLEVISF